MSVANVKHKLKYMLPPPPPYTHTHPTLPAPQNNNNKTTKLNNSVYTNNEHCSALYYLNY